MYRYSVNYTCTELRTSTEICNRQHIRVLLNLSPKCGAGNIQSLLVVRFLRMNASKILLIKMMKDICKFLEKFYSWPGAMIN
jgi:hypothetical protein